MLFITGPSLQPHLAFWARDSRLDWLATEPQGSSCPNLHSSGITGASHHAYVVSEIWTQLFMFAWDTLYQSGWHRSPPALPCKIFFTFNQHLPPHHNQTFLLFQIRPKIRKWKKETRKDQFLFSKVTDELHTFGIALLFLFLCYIWEGLLHNAGYQYFLRVDVQIPRVIWEPN